MALPYAISGLLRCDDRSVVFAHGKEACLIMPGDCVSMHSRLSISTLSRHFALVMCSLLMAGCLSYNTGDDPMPGSQAGSAEPIFVPTTSPTAAQSGTPAPAPPTARAIPDEELPLADIGYTIPLAIRHVTQDTVTLFFELDFPAPASLFIRSREAATQTIEVNLDPTQTRHSLTVSNLSSDTRYEAIVAIGTADGGFQQPVFLSGAWGPVSFQTPRETGTLRIGVIGDASFGDPVTSTLVEEMAEADLDFVLHTGDVVDETEQGVNPFQSYAEKFYTPFAPLLTQMPVYTVIGNHDYDADIRWLGDPFYYHAFPPFADPLFPAQENMARNQYYAFAYRDVQFLMLDSKVFFGQPGREEEEVWLAERLADPRFRMTIPVFHVAPFSSSSVHPTDSLPVRAAWVPLFEDANVPVVLSGHFHEYERLNSNGITYVVASGGSSILYAPGESLPESEVLRRQSHYVLLEIDGEGVTLSAHALGGEVLDRLGLPLR